MMMGLLDLLKKTKTRKSSTQTKDKPKPITLDSIKENFHQCADVIIEKKSFQQQEQKITIHLIKCEGLIDTAKLNKLVLPELRKIIEKHLIQKSTIITDFQNSELPDTRMIQDISEMTKNVFAGNLLLYFEQMKLTFSIDLAKHPQRTPEEPNTEISVKGPRDGFIEELPVNIALVRKRLKSSTLKIEKYCVGTRSQTDIALMYVGDIINEATLTSIKDKLNSLQQVDALFSLYHLQDLLTDTKFKLVPNFNYTGRPDFVVQSLLQGRFTILMDGMPTVILAPVSLSYLSKSPEDSEYITIYVAFTRLLRLTGLIMATFLPGFWVALITFHQSQIPFVMLGTLAETRRGVPFPSPVEAFLMLGMFELFREAGMRLPSAVGQTLTVVGGLIIGQAAIQAGVTNPAMVVVIATSQVATFTLMDQSLVGSITVLRFIVLFFSSFLGLYGEICISFVVLIYLSNVCSFSVPYLSPLSPFSAVDFMNDYLRLPWSQKKKRTKTLQTKDPSRQE